MKLYFLVVAVLLPSLHTQAEEITHCRAEDAVSLLQVTLKGHVNRSRPSPAGSKHELHTGHKGSTNTSAGHVGHTAHKGSRNTSAGHVGLHASGSAHAAHTDLEADLEAGLEADLEADLEAGRSKAHAHHHHQLTRPQQAYHMHHQVHEKFACHLMLFMLCTLCCCGGVIRQVAGDQKAAAVSLCLSVGMLFYIWYSGIWHAWWSGDPGLGLACRIMCWWVLVLIVFWISVLFCLCCAVGVLFGAAIIIQNQVIKEMQEKFEDKEKNLSGPRREYYKSPLFKQKCDKIFDKADKSRTGKLSAHELEPVVKEELEIKSEDGGSGQLAYFMTKMFDKNGDSEVGKDEFSEMMKFLSVMQLEDGRFNLKQAFEVLLLSPDAKMADVNRSYRKLAIKYHPDKRPNEDKAVVDKDMSEINDAKALLEKHFAEQEGKKESGSTPRSSTGK